MHNVSQDFAACPANNFSLSILPSFPYDRHIRRIMRAFNTAAHWNTANPLFLKLLQAFLPQMTSSYEKEVLRVWWDFNSCEENLTPSIMLSARKHLIDGARKTGFLEYTRLTCWPFRPSSIRKNWRYPNLVVSLSFSFSVYLVIGFGANHPNPIWSVWGPQNIQGIVLTTGSFWLHQDKGIDRNGQKQRIRVSNFGRSPPKRLVSLNIVDNPLKWDDTGEGWSSEAEPIENDGCWMGVRKPDNVESASRWNPRLILRQLYPSSADTNTNINTNKNTNT